MAINALDADLETMTPKRRFLAALFGGRVDRPPVCTLSSTATMELMDLVDAPFPEAHLDAEKMARLAACSHEVLGFDTIMPVFHAQLEASALGGDTVWGEKDNWPAVRDPVLSDPDDFVMPDDYLEQPSFKAVLGALRILRKAYPDVALVGKVYGPWSVAYHLVGIENFLMDVILDPDKVRRYIEVLTPPCLLSAWAQIEAGADAIMWCDHLTADLCRMETYRDFMLPVHQEITEKIGAPCILHCCGRTIDRVHLFADAGWDCFHFESQVDPYEARRIIGQRMSLIGNINNPSTLLQGTPEEAYRAALYALEGGANGVAPEGSVPLVTPLENLKALKQAVVDFAKRRRAERTPPAPGDQQG
ncbi:MAG TPA: MtaA/CmuA family methyltransferase [Chloroflexota bacterium]